MGTVTHDKRRPFQFKVAALKRLALAAALFLPLALLGPSPAFAKYASMVIDADTGEIFHASHVDDRNHPASLTKIMTLYLLFDDMDSGKVHLGDTMPVSSHAAAQAPSKLGLSPGERVSVEDAMLGIITKSANDAAVVVAEYLAGGSEQTFTQRMTRKARELGMRVSEFHNANGLPNPKQISSARDMATLARALIHNHAKYYHYFSTRQFVYDGQVMPNHNHLMETYDGMDGIKTGFVDASGFNLVASAKRDGRRLIGVVFGGTSASERDRHMANLLDAAFARLPGSGPTLQMAENSNISDTVTDDEDTHKVMAAMTQGKRAVTVKKPARKAATVAVGDADDEDDWGVQLGTFSKRDKAVSVAKAVYAKLGQTASDGDPVAVADKHRHWHARITGLSSEAAHQSCRRLTKLHQACRVIGDASN